MKTANIIVGQNRADLTEFLALVSRNGEYKIQLAKSGQDVLALLRKPPYPDLVILENTLRDPDVRQVCHEIKIDPVLSLVPILMIAEGSQDDPLPVLSGCDDILIGPVKAPALLARMNSLIRLKSLYENLDSAESVLSTLARAIEAKDPYTLGHADRVSHFAVELGKAMGVGGLEVEILRKGGLLHDVGKIAI